jgi:2-dehydropantoate 2-reductase
MRIAILGGAGGMGGAFGAKLATGGHDVTLFDVSAQAVDVINEQGLVIEKKDGSAQTYKVPATTDVASLGKVDLLINFVKCYHTESAVRSVLPALTPNSFVLSLQNGWGNAPTIGAIVGAERVIMGVTYHSATVLAPGRVLHAGIGATYVGPLVGEASVAQPVVEALKQADLDAVLCDDVREQIFAKLLLNICTLPTSSLLRLGACQLVQTESCKDIMRALLSEGVQVARANNIAVDEQERWEAITGLLAKAGMSKSSMLQDVQAGRATEIDVINGAIVALGRAKGIATPCNELMVNLIKTATAKL